MIDLLHHSPMNRPAGIWTQIPWYLRWHGNFSLAMLSHRSQESYPLDYRPNGATEIRTQIAWSQITSDSKLHYSSAGHFLKFCKVFQSLSPCRNLNPCLLVESQIWLSCLHYRGIMCLAGFEPAFAQTLRRSSDIYSRIPSYQLGALTVWPQAHGGCAEDLTRGKRSTISHVDTTPHSHGLWSGYWHPP